VLKHYDDSIARCDSASFRGNGVSGQDLPGSIQVQLLRFRSEIP
jgi:hypothetical protein